MSVTDLNEYREAQKPHVSGAAVCLSCKHEWEAIAPVEREPACLECPSCGLHKGEMDGNCAPDDDEPLWRCHCDNAQFFIVAAGAFCIGCGSVTPWSELNDSF